MLLSNDVTRSRMRVCRASRIRQMARRLQDMMEREGVRRPSVAARRVRSNEASHQSRPMRDRLRLATPINLGTGQAPGHGNRHCFDNTRSRSRRRRQAPTRPPVRHQCVSWSRTTLALANWLRGDQLTTPQEPCDRMLPPLRRKRTRRSSTAKSLECMVRTFGTPARALNAWHVPKFPAIRVN